MIGEIIRYIWKECLYTLFSVFYLVKLNVFNKELLRLGLETNPFKLVTYNDGEPVRYFIAALFLGIIGSVLIYIQLKSILQYRCNSGREVLIRSLMIVLVVCIIIAIVILIDNPIARAVIIASTVIAIVSKSV